MRQGAFEMQLTVGGDSPLPETAVEHRSYVLAKAGQAFEVLLRNDNRATYMVRLFVDGTEAEPGYVKKLRPDSSTRFRGFLCKRDVHEFIFAQTPVDEKAAPSSLPSQSQLGEVKALVYATRRVRVEESSSDEDGSHRSSASIAVRALPEKSAIKEFGVQARAGSSVERLRNHRRRRRGDYRLEKVTPPVATLSIFYRDDFWWERRKPARAPRASSSPGGKPPAAQEAPPAKATIKREPGETGRGPDGKRRKLATAGKLDEVVELSD